MRIWLEIRRKLYDKQKSNYRSVNDRDHMTADTLMRISEKHVSLDKLLNKIRYQNMFYRLYKDVYGFADSNNDVRIMSKKDMDTLGIIERLKKENITLDIG